MIRNQNGLTLIEVLITLTLLSVIGLILWSVLIDGISYSEKAASKNTVQQEANIIAMGLTKIHQTSDDYEIVSKECKLNVKYWIELDPDPQIKIFEHPQLCISSNETTDIKDFDPDTNDFHLNLTIYDKSKPENKLNVTTTLFRLKEE
ncbi:PulJ/GspJ family protein [[Bacillus] enclensis]|uniref:PulJ/GspJ family protein n=1 Tax=[Bacillus] enclensis TaxID=1402860 RepID=UPI0018DDF259|nr:prepilin-type N-terminal cleavage/methylation domain-containing protein [[Bacillus] enclensis]MBH9968199.1 prepilin-type N-terminal cleavage/methylation domain-containing protein [[Bacillus] enclensis]